MADKGILPSNPDVAAMTHNQWVMEVAWLTQRRNERNKEITNIVQGCAEAFRDLLVSMFGIGLGQPEGKILPLVYWVGRPEMIKKMIEKEESGNKTDPTLDPELDAFSDYIRSLDIKDVEVIIREDKSYDEEEHKRLLRAAGILLYEDVSVEDSTEDLTP